MGFSGVPGRSGGRFQKSGRLRSTAGVPVSAASRSTPSAAVPATARAPVKWSRVGVKSTAAITDASSVVPRRAAGMNAGPHAMSGSRTPPS